MDPIIIFPRPPCSGCHTFNAFQGTVKQHTVLVQFQKQSNPGMQVSTASALPLIGALVLGVTVKAIRRLF